MLNYIDNAFGIVLNFIATAAEVLVIIGYYALALVAAIFVLMFILAVFGVASWSALPSVIILGLIIGFANLIPMVIVDALDS